MTTKNSFAQSVFSQWWDVLQKLQNRPKSLHNDFCLDIWKSINLPVVVGAQGSHMELQKKLCHTNTDTFVDMLKTTAIACITAFGDVLLSDSQSPKELSDLLRRYGPKKSNPIQQAVGVYFPMRDLSIDEWDRSEAQWDVVSFAVGHAWVGVAYNFEQYTNLQPHNKNDNADLLSDTDGECGVLDQTIFDQTSISTNIDAYPWHIWRALENTYGFGSFSVDMRLPVQNIQQATMTVHQCATALSARFKGNHNIASLYGMGVALTLPSQKFSGAYVYEQSKHQIVLCCPPGQAGIKAEEIDPKIVSTFVHEWTHALEFHINQKLGRVFTLGAKNEFVASAKKKSVSGENLDPQQTHIYEQLLMSLSRVHAVIQSIPTDPQRLKDFDTVDAHGHGRFVEAMKEIDSILDHWVATYGHPSLRQQWAEKTQAEMRHAFWRTLNTFGDDSDKRRALDKLFASWGMDNVPRDQTTNLVMYHLRIKHLRKMFDKDIQHGKSVWMAASRLEDMRAGRVFGRYSDYWALPSEMLARAAQTVVPSLLGLPTYVHPTNSLSAVLYPQRAEADVLYGAFDQLFVDIHNLLEPSVAPVSARDIQRKRSVETTISQPSAPRA